MTDNKITLSNGQIDVFVAKTLLQKPIIVSLIIIVYCIVNIFKYGMDDTNLIILIGVVLSILGIIGHMLLFLLIIIKGPEWSKRGGMTWILVMILNNGGFRNIERP